MKRLLAILGLLVSLSLNVEAATYWVDGTNGSDASGCNNSATPLTTTAKRTIQNALENCMRSSDTLYIRSGVYAESLSRSSSSLFPNGTAGAYTRIARWQNESVTIRSPFSGDNCAGDGACRALYLTANRYVEFDGLILDGVNQTVNDQGGVCIVQSPQNGIQAIMLDACPNCNYTQTTPDSYTHHIRIINSEIKNWPGYAISVGGPQVAGCETCAGHHELINNVIHDVGKNRYVGQHVAIYLSTYGWLVERNRIYDVPSAITVYNTTHHGQNKDVVIRYNEIFRTANVHPGCDVGPAILVGNIGANPLIHNNLIYDNYQGGIHVYVGNDARIYNNTLYNSRGSGEIILDNTNAVSTVIRNNILYRGPSTGSPISGNGLGTVQSNNLTTDPSFVDAANGNFTLQASSSAINAGTDLSSVFTTDIAGVARPQGSGWDIGAYAGNAVSVNPIIVPPTVPSAPWGLRVDIVK